MDSPLVRGIQKRLDNMDKKVSYAVFSKAQKLTPRIKPYLVALEWSCNGIFWLALAMLLILYDRQQTSMVPKLLIGLIVDIFWVAIIKALARRRRPTYAYQRDQMIVSSIDKHSFPSGHCSRSTYLALFASHFFARHSPVLVFLVSAWCINVCVSRVLLGRHHILDCVAGGVLGWLNHSLQFYSPLPINAIGMFLIRSMFGNKSFNDPNDVEGSDAFE